jgi:hypothetical protein
MPQKRSEQTNRSFSSEFAELKLLVSLFSQFCTHFLFLDPVCKGETGPARNGIGEVQ